MKVFLYMLFLIIVLSCKRSDIETIEKDSVLNEYADWYTLKAPVDRQIEGVWGNFDKTILISTMFKLFRSTDKGKHWKLVQVTWGKCDSNHSYIVKQLTVNQRRSMRIFCRMVA